MTLLLLASLLAAEPAPLTAPEAEKAAAPLVVPQPRAAVVVAPTAPAIPPADVPDEVSRAADESMGFLLFRTLVVLGLVVMLAYVSLNWGLRKMLGLKGPSGGGGSVLSVIERVPLDQRHALFVVKAAGEYLLVGGGGESLGLIAKLDTAEVDKLRAERPAPLTLSPLLQKLLAKKGSK